MNFNIIRSNRNIQATALALGTKIQQSLHLPIDIIVKARHTQQAPNITPQHLHLTLHESFLQIKVDIRRIQAIVRGVMLIGLLEGNLE